MKAMGAVQHGSGSRFFAPQMHSEKAFLAPTELPLYSQASTTGSRSWKRIFASWLLVLHGVWAFLLLSRFLGGRAYREPAALSRNPAYLIEADHGAVASENKVCSEVGVATLKDGGNAVDAAVSTIFCVGVINMFSSGIGGGGFMTVRIPPTAPNSSSEVFTIDFRETAPALTNSTMYAGNPDAAKWGGLAVGVPGELRGLEEMHRRWGTVPWRKLVQPSIDLANGWAVDTELGRRIELFGELMLNAPDWSAIFAPKGVLLREGDRIARKNLARTLTTIASEGPGAFYEGPIADALIRKIRLTGGILTHEDLASYKVKVLPALTGSYRGRKVYTTNPPTSGGVLLHMLNLIEHYDLESEGRSGRNVHRLIETMKFGFAARTKICDPDFNNNTERMAEISTKKYAANILPNITDERTHSPEYYQPEYDVEEDHGTSHTSVVDENGMAVSITTTVNLIFGSAVMDPETGVILNDEMDDFSTPGTPNGFGLWPSPYNYPEPGKRSLSSTVPTIIENADGSLHLVIGGSGGSRIFPSVFQTIINLDEWGLDVGQAIEHGRVHDQLYPLVVDVDSTYPGEILDELREKGHNITVSSIDRIAAVVQAIHVKDGKLFAASDSRKNGIAAGY